MNCPKCNEDIMSMSVHYCNPNQTNRTMNTPTPRTDEWLAEEKRNPRISGLGNWLDYCKTLERELTAAREELVETRKDFMCLAELLDGHDATECRMNLVRLKEQRDRLAEALYPFSQMMGGHMFLGYEYVKKAHEALQSLNQPTP